MKALAMYVCHPQLTLFAGMYAITVTLFTLETGSFLAGLGIGLVAASLKTIWASLHHRLHKGKGNTIEYEDVWKPGIGD